MFPYLFLPFLTSLSVFFFFKMWSCQCWDWVVRIWHSPWPIQHLTGSSPATTNRKQVLEVTLKPQRPTESSHPPPQSNLQKPNTSWDCLIWPDVCFSLGPLYVISAWPWISGTVFIFTSVSQSDKWENNVWKGQMVSGRASRESGQGWGCHSESSWTRGVL